MAIKEALEKGPKRVRIASREELKIERKSEIQIDLEAVSDGIENQPNDRGEMSNEAMSSKILDIASCGVETSEGDPIRSEALANDIRQHAISAQGLCVSVRPNICRSAQPPRAFLFYGPSAYRVGTHSLVRAQLRGARFREFKSCIPRSGVHAPAGYRLQKHVVVRWRCAH